MAFSLNYILNGHVIAGVCYSKYLTRVTRTEFSVTVTVKREYLVPIIFCGFSNMTIWQGINLAISNTAIYKDCNVIIW